MKKKQIVAIVGMAGAGKSEAASYFSASGIPVLRFGDQTDIGLKEMGKKLTEKNERWYRETLRKKLGMAAYAIKIMPRIESAFRKHDIVILDGLYSWEEYVFLKDKFSTLLLLCIYASPRVRYERLMLRSHRGLSKQSARSRDIAELENLNKGGPIAISDYLIKNESSRRMFKMALSRFLRTLQYDTRKKSS